MENNQNAQAEALIRFAGRMATMVEQGISFVRIMEHLEDTAEPYGSEAKRLKECLQASETLSEAMMERRDLYSRYHIGIVRAGEIGGILATTLRIAADMLALEWRIMSRDGERAAALLIACPSTRHAPESWESLSRYQRTANQYLLCQIGGSMLAAGVPVLRSIDVIGNLVPRTQLRPIHEISASIERGEPIDAARLGMLPDSVVALIDQAEVDGTMAATLLKAAATFRAELDALAAA